MPGVKAPGVLMKKNRISPAMGPFQERMKKKYEHSR